MTSKESPGTNPEPELCVWLKPGELLTNPSLNTVKVDGEKKKSVAHGDRLLQVTPRPAFASGPSL